VPTEKRQRQKEGQRARREAALIAARRQQRKRKLRAIAVVVVAVALVGAIASQFGGDDKPSAASSSTTTTTSEPTTPSTTKANPDDKPAIEVPKTPAPADLVSTDLKVGDGAEAKLGDTIEVNYVGVTYADGKEFDSSWSRSATVAFDLVEGGLIEGWTKGVPGMKVGGRRQLIIPASQAYGDNPAGGGPAGALIFIIDLVSIQ
jgi:peptidylprolyl isomerase